MELDQHKRPGFRIRDYFISFPSGEFITENEDGTLGLMVDIFKMDVNNNLHPITKEDNIDELQPEIEAWVNTALEHAIEQAEREHGVKLK